MIDLINFIKIDNKHIGIFDDRHAINILEALKVNNKVKNIYPKIFNIKVLLKTIFLSRLIYKQSDSRSDFFMLFKLSYKLLLVNPSKVVSTRFWNITFQKLNRIHKSYFIGIMPGLGGIVDEEKIWGIKYKDLCLDELLVLGHFSEKIIKSASSKINKITTIGSIDNSLYLLKKNTLKKEYDICIVSNIKPHYGNFKYYGPFFKELSKVCNELKLRVCFAGRGLKGDSYHEEVELPILKSFKYQIDYYPRDGHNTYKLCDSSNITIGDFTTSIYESFARGNKLIAANPSEIELYDFFIDGIWVLKKFNFNGIKDKIIELLDMSADDWNRETIIAREQLIFNSNSVKPIDDFSKIIIK